MKRLTEDFMRSNTYKHRLLFLDFLELAAQSFSRNFFKKHGLTAILDYAADKVANVRIRFCQILFPLRWMIDDDDEEQEEILERFNKISKRIVLDSDRDVKNVKICLYISLVCYFIKSYFHLMFAEKCTNL
jgi:hypothetical protein